MSLAELGEIAKASNDRDKSHMGRYLAGAGIGGSIAGSEIARRGVVHTNNALKPAGDYYDFDEKLSRKGTKMIRHGNRLTTAGGALILLGAGAGIANIHHQRRAHGRPRPQ